MPKTLLRSKSIFGCYRLAPMPSLHGLESDYLVFDGHRDANRSRTEAERSTYSAQPRSRETQYLAYLRDQNLAWWGRWRGRDARRARGPASAGCLPSGTPAPDSGTDSRAQSGWWTGHTRKNISPDWSKNKRKYYKYKRTFCGPNMADRPNKIKQLN